MKNKLHETLKDGVYSVTLSDGQYRAEKINGVWFFADGTGWMEKMEYPEEIVAATDISDLPVIEKNTEYENKYPLTDFFSK